MPKRPQEAPRGSRGPLGASEVVQAVEVKPSLWNKEKKGKEVKKIRSN